MKKELTDEEKEKLIEAVNRYMTATDSWVSQRSYVSIQQLLKSFKESRMKG